MKKFFILLLIGTTLWYGSFAQFSLKLSEISADRNSIELYTPTTGIDLDCYSLVSIVWGSSNTASLYVLNFPSVTVANVAGNSTNQNFLVCSSASSEFNWINGSNYYVTKYSLSGASGNNPYVLTGGTGNPVQVTNTSEIIVDAKPVVFLLKGNSVIDVFAAGIGTNISSVQSTISKIPAFNLNPCSSTGLASVNLGNTIIANFQTVFTNAAVGSGYSYQWSSTSSGGTCQSIWQNALVGLNGGTVTNIATWDDIYLQRIGNTNPETWNEVTNSSNTYSSTSTSFVRNSVGKITAFEFRIRVQDPYPFTVTSTNPTIKLFKDNGGNSAAKNNSVFEATDNQILSTSFSVSLTSVQNTLQVSVPFSEIYDIADTSRLFNLFIQMNESSSTCFASVSILRFPTLAALPVSLKTLTINTKGNLNSLIWNTSSEQNNKGFEIQRSIGNTNDFKTIGFVGTRAKDGNSQTEISYSFEDADVKAGQTHYYRLNQIDFDGKATLSPVRSVKPGSIESNLNVYPNPSQGNVTVNTGSASGKLNIYVIDNGGRVVNQYINVSTSNVRINNLKKGFYTLKLVNTETGEQSAQRVVVQ